MTDFSVDYLNKLQEAVDRFQDVFEEWMKTQEEFDRKSSRGLFPTVQTRQGEDVGKVRRLELDVAAASGLAARAVQITGACIVVSGVTEPIDPIANWFTMSQPKSLLDPRDIRMAVSTIKGRLDALIRDVQSSAKSQYPVFSPAKFHAVVWSKAVEFWTIHQYRVAVREAAEGLTSH